jgi:methyl-accepting chemotaxis protein
LKKLTTNTDIDDSLERLDQLTQEEARMASAELLKMTHSVDGKVMGVDDRVKNVEGKVEDVHGDVHDVVNKVQDIDHRVQSIGSNISSRVQGVDDKSDQANRSLSLLLCSSFQALIFLRRKPAQR